MTRLTQFLDWLDNAAGGMIRIAYLAAGVTAVAVYFGAGHLPAAVEDPLNAALPWSLAFAVETHTYITARRVRAAWQEKAWAALKVNLAILAGLLAFGAWNQLGYLSTTWHPNAVAVFALPLWLSYVVRALVVPCAFMAAAFLAPLAEPITAQIETEARSVLSDVFRIARKQRRRMLKDAERSGRDMTGALVELVGDAETRRIIAHAYGAIGAPMAATASPALPESKAVVRVASTLPAMPETVHQAPPSPPPVVNYAAMHGDDGDYPITDDLGYTDEINDADDWGDDGPKITGSYSLEELTAEIAAAQASTTSNSRKNGRSAIHSGPKGTTKSRAERISDGMKRSHKERRRETAGTRKRIVHDLLFDILNEFQDEGMPAKLTDHELADDVFRRANGLLIVVPSDNTIRVLREEWEKKNARELRRANAEQYTSAMSQPIVPDDVVDMMQYAPGDDERELEPAW